MLVKKVFICHWYLALVLAASSCVFAADRPAMITVNLRIYEGDPLNKNANASKLIAEPTIVTKNGEAATFVSGGELQLENERGVELQFGLTCEVKATLLDAERMLVEVRAEHTKPERHNDRQVTIAGGVARSVQVGKPGDAILVGPLERGKDKPLWIQARAELYDPDQPRAKPTPIVVRAESPVRATRSPWTTIRDRMRAGGNVVLNPLGLIR